MARAAGENRGGEAAVAGLSHKVHANSFSSVHVIQRAEPGLVVSFAGVDFWASARGLRQVMDAGSISAVFNL